MRIGTSIISAASLSFSRPRCAAADTKLGSNAQCKGTSGYGYRAACRCFSGHGYFFLTVLAFNLLGDGLRDALDRKLKDSYV